MYLKVSKCSLYVPAAFYHSLLYDYYAGYKHGPKASRQTAQLLNTKQSPRYCTQSSKCLPRTPSMALAMAQPLAHSTHTSSLGEAPTVRYLIPHNIFRSLPALTYRTFAREITGILAFSLEAPHTTTRTLVRVSSTSPLPTTLSRKLTCVCLCRRWLILLLQLQRQHLLQQRHRILHLPLP